MHCLKRISAPLARFPYRLLLVAALGSLLSATLPADDTALDPLKAPLGPPLDEAFAPSSGTDWEPQAAYTVAVAAERSEEDLPPGTYAMVGSTARDKDSDAEAAPVEASGPIVAVGQDDALEGDAEEEPVEAASTPQETSAKPAPALPDPEEVDFEVPTADEVAIEFPRPESGPEVTDFEEETISVDFPDEDVRTIIRQVADLYDLNVVIPDTLVGSTSIKLRNVTWRQVFDVILEPIGYTYVENRNIISIKSRDELLQEPVDTRVFVINYANAGDLQASISPLVDTAAGGRMQVDRRSNALVITERPSRFNNIQEIIQRLDRPTPQVMIESKFIDVTGSDVKNIGVNWASLSGWELGAGNLRRTYSDSRGYDNEVRNESFQQQRTETTNTTVDDGMGPQTQTTTTTTTSVNEPLRRTVDLVTSAAQGRVDSAVFSASDFGVVLSALKTFNDSELVSNPTVVTLNNTEASINIGEEFPIPNYTYNDERGSFEVSGFDYKKIGIILNVTPQVNSAGFINLNIVPEVSSRTGTVNFGGASGAEIPIVSTRKTQSTITIKDGYTLAIGGLLETSNVDEDTKVPVLGDVPGLGRLFRSSSETETRRNLIIFITAKTLNPDGSTYEDIIDQRQLTEMGLTESDLPGYDLSDEEISLARELRALREKNKLDALRGNLQSQIEAMQRRELEAEKDSDDSRNAGLPRRGPRSH